VLTDLFASSMCCTQEFDMALYRLNTAPIYDMFETLYNENSLKLSQYINHTELKVFYLFFI
jgi:hypothetical protein